MKLKRLLTLLAVLAVLAAACGGGGGEGDDTASEDTGSASGTEEAEETTEPAAEETTEATEEETTEATEEETTEATEEETTDGATEGGDVAPNEGDGTFHVGTLLPETGSLAFLGPPEFAGAELAVNRINEAGGVLGEEVQLTQGDSGDTSTDIANQTTDRLLNEGVDVIVGAASSGVSFTVIDKITGAGVIQFSPANTSPDFTDYDDNGLYFRTAPSDVLQGRVLAELMLEEGATTISIMALQDPYGEGLLNFVTEAFTEGGGEVLESIIYDPQAQNFDAEVGQVAAAGADANVLIGFDESARIITSMIENGIGPNDVPLYLVDGNTGNALGEQFSEQGVLVGAKGTTPYTEINQEFQDALLEVDPELVDFNYGPETYDAIIITALAAEIAGTDEPTAVAAEINGVTRDGTTCTEFAQCRDLIAEGEDIDYDGVAGPYTFGDAGEPTEASFGIFAFQEDNTLAEPEIRFAQLSE